MQSSAVSAFLLFKAMDVLKAALLLRGESVFGST